MKRTFAKLLSLFVVLTLVIAMVPAVFAVGEKVSAGKNTLSVNESTTVSVTDANGTAVPNVTLSSDHDDIVSVIDSSTIKALKVGSATITATVTAEDKTVQTLGSVQITVQSGVSAITPDTSSIEIDADNAKTASLSVTLMGAASGDVLAVQSSDNRRDGTGWRYHAFGRHLHRHADGGEDRHGCGHAQLRHSHGAGRCDRQGDERPYRDL